MVRITAARETDPRLLDLIQKSLALWFRANASMRGISAEHVSQLRSVTGPKMSATIGKEIHPGRLAFALNFRQPDGGHPKCQIAKQHEDSFALGVVRIIIYVGSNSRCRRLS